MNIYVGNLPYGVKEEELQAMFEEHGKVTSVSLIKDKYTGQSKGFGFVEMDNQAAAEAAIKAINGRAVNGRTITANVARPRTERSASKPRRW
jgi:RNA recognition motif-containing protein